MNHSRDSPCISTGKQQSLKRAHVYAFGTGNLRMFFVTQGVLGQHRPLPQDIYLINLGLSSASAPPQ